MERTGSLTVEVLMGRAPRISTHCLDGLWGWLEFLGQRFWAFNEECCGMGLLFCFRRKGITNMGCWEG